ncbi:hypothetical protein IMCC21906_01593 [Spongiibacter sp. IMCC21906]|nr:hypothetical protein IMCC21906_01593 [Spongiibacter sp. IMCC21906]
MKPDAQQGETNAFSKTVNYDRGLEQAPEGQKTFAVGARSYEGQYPVGGRAEAETLTCGR